MNYDENVFKEKANRKARRYGLYLPFFFQPTMVLM